MMRRSTDTPGPAASGEALLRQGLAEALQDIGSGRAALRQAAALFDAAGDERGHTLARCALVLFTGIADDDYTGFEAAATALAGLPVEARAWADPGEALLVQAGTLTAGAFQALDAPGLAANAAAIAAALAEPRIAPALRCAAGLAALGYHHIGMDLAGVLWLELALRPLRSDPAVGARLAGEALHMLVQSLYQCEAPAEAAALLERYREAGAKVLPVIELKLLLLDAQMALGAGTAVAVERGRAALAQAEPLLDPRAPRQAGWWHLLRSRLDLLDGEHRQALVHARLALRLASQSQLPERWMGVTVMQEGHVQMAIGAWPAALPFFERAGRAASGNQARFCWCLAHLARALAAFEADDAAGARGELAQGLAIARELAWLHFFRALPAVAAGVCALALEHGIEAAFVREVIAARGLHAVRPDLSAWPWPVRVHALGGLRIEVDGQPLVARGKVAKKPLELLLFVVASGGSEVSLATVAFALWRELEGDKARAALNVALHRLRRLLGHDEAVLLQHGRLSLNARLVWVDCLAFEHLADSAGGVAADAAGLPAPARTAAERALALYGGAFLRGSDDEAWQLLCRARLASKFKRIVNLLAQDAALRGDAAAAQALRERAREADLLAQDMSTTAAPGSAPTAAAHRAPRLARRASRS